MGAFLLHFSADRNVIVGVVHRVQKRKTYVAARIAAVAHSEAAVGQYEQIAKRLFACCQPEQAIEDCAAADGSPSNTDEHGLGRKPDVDVVLCAVAVSGCTRIPAGCELRSHSGLIRHGLERGVDFCVVGVEVVHHDAVGLRPLVEQLAIFYIYSILNPASTSSAV